MGLGVVLLYGLAHADVLVNADGLEHADVLAIPFVCHVCYQ